MATKTSPGKPKKIMDRNEKKPKVSLCSGEAIVRMTRYTGRARRQHPIRR
jgi:hypothetical protein